MENNKKTEVICTSFEYVGDEFFSLDDGMMMQFFSILLSKTSSTAPLLFIAPLMLIWSPSTIWNPHKLFSPSGWHWNEMYRERKRAQRKKIRGKEKKNQYRRETAQEATHFFILFRTHLSFFLALNVVFSGPSFAVRCECWPTSRCSDGPVIKWGGKGKCLEWWINY